MATAQQNIQALILNQINDGNGDSLITINKLWEIFNTISDVSGYTNELQSFVNIEDSFSITIAPSYANQISCFISFSNSIVSGGNIYFPTGINNQKLTLGFSGAYSNVALGDIFNTQIDGGVLSSYSFTWSNDYSGWVIS
jgi:hypothetical protein